ncbi:MAG: hypothetical protein A3E80_02580 [Chlamydiae bacterium RIFCSPHIGHO2_12_FULL_49_9]|nr:MAG: hypothetical protein A3E80_02580 [Chlamydiae bacterium RIFCSPHIGHO2_12_FULL_49_9]
MIPPTSSHPVQPKPASHSSRSLKKLTKYLRKFYVLCDYNTARTSLQWKDRQLTGPEKTAIGNPQEIGRGSYGRVVKLHNGTIAKIYKKDEEAKIPINEAAALELFSQYTHIPSLGAFTKIQLQGQKLFCTVMEHGGESLKERFAYPLDFVKRMAEILAETLSVMHARFTAHLDIKPANCTVNKVIDLGLSRVFFNGSKNHGETTTLWYRAPEIALGRPYDWRADLWSFGCTLFELYVGKPLFPAQYNEDLSYCHQKRFQQESSGLEWEIRGKFCNEIEDLEDLERFIDLLKQLLKFNPEKRISAKEVLRHPFFNQRFSIRCFIDLPFRSQMDDNCRLEMKDKNSNTVLGTRISFIKPGVPFFFPIRGEPFVAKITTPQCVHAFSIESIADRCTLRFPKDLNQRVTVLLPAPLLPTSDPIKPTPLKKETRLEPAGFSLFPWFAISQSSAFQRRVSLKS